MIPPSQVRRARMIIRGGQYKGTYMVFPINPVPIIESRAARYVDHQPWLRGSPIQQHTGTEAKVISFEMPIEAKSEVIYFRRIGVTYLSTNGVVLEPLETTPFPTGDVKLRRVYQFLDSLTLPRRTSIGATTRLAAPSVLFVYGDQLTFRCTVRSVQAEWTDFASGSNNPIRGIIRVDLREIDDNPFHAKVLVDGTGLLDHEKPESIPEDILRNQFLIDDDPLSEARTPITLSPPELPGEDG